MTNATAFDIAAAAQYGLTLDQWYEELAQEAAKEERKLAMSGWGWKPEVPSEAEVEAAAWAARWANLSEPFPYEELAIRRGYLH